MSRESVLLLLSRSRQQIILFIPSDSVGQASADFELNPTATVNRVVSVNPGKTEGCRLPHVLIEK